MRCPTRLRREANALGDSPGHRTSFSQPFGCSKGRAADFLARKFLVTELRSRVLRMRLTETEWQTLGQRAILCELPLSSYVREAALGHAPKPRRGRLEQQALYHLGRIGNNLNQLTRAANATRRVELSHRLDETLEQLLDAIRRLV